MHGMRLYADEVMHSKTRRCKLHIWLFRGGDACTHNLPLSGYYKGNFPGSGIRIDL